MVSILTDKHSANPNTQLPHAGGTKAKLNGLSNSYCCVYAGTGLLNGRSEQLLGQFVQEYPGSTQQKDSICIATKLAPYPWRLTSGAYQVKLLPLQHGPPIR